MALNRPALLDSQAAAPKKRTPYLTLATLACSLILLRAHTLVAPEYEGTILIAAAAPLWFVIIGGSGLLLRRRTATSETSGRSMRLVLALVGSFALLGFLRAALEQVTSQDEALKHTLGWVTVALFALASARLLSRWRLRRGLVLALVAYVGLNVVLVLWSQITGRGDFGIFYGRASMLSSLGWEAERVLFPTSPGFNSFGIMAGATLASLLPLVWHERRNGLKAAYSVGLAAAVMGLLMADNRSALLFGAMTGVFATLSSVRILRVSTWAPTVSPALPVLFVVAVALFAELSPSSALIRNAEASGANVRVEVWNVILARLAEPSVRDLVGYGYMGHVTSGVSAEYVPVVARQMAVIPGVSSYQADLDLRVTAHNYVLQSILDNGYVGTLLLILLLTYLARQVFHDLREYRQPIDRAMLSLLSFMVLIGTTETLFAPYNAEAFSLFILAAIACTKRGKLGHEQKPLRWRQLAGIAGANPHAYSKEVPAC